MLKPALGIAALALALSACGPGDSELDGDLMVNGMDPVTWGMKVDRQAKTATIMVIGDRDITGAPPVKSKGTEDGVTVLTSTTPDGDFVMNLRQEACKDGLSDREYHWSVVADWKGEALKGCAGSISAPG
jgi:uncharacterized membrane protein